MSEAAPRTRYCSRCLTTFSSDAERCPNLGCRSGRPASGWGELLDTGELIDRTYRVHKRLAIGGAGVTYLAREVGAADAEVGPLLAVKVLYQQRDQGPYLRRLSTEAQILQGLNHPQIVECRGFVHRSGHSPYLVTRFEAGGSLLDHIRRVGLLPPPVAAGVAMQVCDALAVAHRQGVIHRDLKPENVLLEAEVPRNEVPRIRVADFGIAKVFGGVGDRLTRVGAFIGTPQYAAPEQFEGMAPEPATDVYAVGALLYFCITARPVADFMNALDPEDQRDHLIRHLPPRLTGLQGDEIPWLEATLAAAMTPDPGDRCAIDHLAERLHSIALGKDPGPLQVPPPAPGPWRTAPGESPPQAIGTISSAGRAPLPQWQPLAGDLSADALPPVSSGAATPPSVTPSSAGGAPPAPLRSAQPVTAQPVTAQPVTAQPVTAQPVTAQPVTAQPVAGQTAAPAAAPAAPAGRPLPPRAEPPAPPKPRPELQPSRTQERSLGQTAATTSVGCLAVGALGAAVVGIGGLAWWMLQEQPVVLTGKEADPAVVADWQGIAYTLGERGVAAERACGAVAYLAVEVVVAEDGAVQSAALLNYPHEPTRLCVEKELKKERFPRTGKGLVRVGVQMTR